MREREGEIGIPAQKVEKIRPGNIGETCWKWYGQGEETLPGAQ